MLSNDPLYARVPVEDVTPVTIALKTLKTLCLPTVPLATVSINPKSGIRLRISISIVHEFRRMMKYRRTITSDYARIRALRGCVKGDRSNLHVAEKNLSEEFTAYLQFS